MSRVRVRQTHHRSSPVFEERTARPGGKSPRPLMVNSRGELDVRGSAAGACAANLLGRRSEDRESNRCGRGFRSCKDRRLVRWHADPGAVSDRLNGVISIRAIVETRNPQWVGRARMGKRYESEQDQQHAQHTRMSQRATDLSEHAR